MTLVEGLELVETADEKRQRSLIVAGVFQLVGEALVQIAVVVEAREAVGDGIELMRLRRVAAAWNMEANAWATSLRKPSISAPLTPAGGVSTSTTAQISPLGPRRAARPLTQTPHWST